MSSTANPFQVHPFLQGILRAAEDEAWIEVRFNGIKMLLPAGTILTMAHCLKVADDGSLNLDVETAHLDWMRSKLKPGSVFLDVGSATGAMTLPIAMQFPGVEIVAFEPARRARKLLTASLIRNDLLGVKVLPSAVSDRDGVVSFADRPVSEDGSVPFLPETSTIVSPGQPDPYGEVVDVNTVTLNTIAKLYGLANRQIVIKMDIEGFEIQALKGANELLNSNVVFLAIDIHKIPDGEVTTEAGCRRILQTYGYKTQEMLGHVLLCSR